MTEYVNYQTLGPHAYCAACKKRVAITVTSFTHGQRSHAMCVECGRTWPVGRGQ